MFKSNAIISISLATISALFSYKSKAQSQSHFFDSIQKKYHIPAVGYAVISQDSILEMNIYGESKVNTGSPITFKHRFHIGSNTKAVTSLAAANLVSKEIIKWNTSVIEIFPEFKKYNVENLTLFDLLNFKAPLAPFTYSNPVPKSVKISGNDFEHRYKLIDYLLTQKSVTASDGLYLTNTGYILAGLMLEKASGTGYKKIVIDLGKELGIDFHFGSPNRLNYNQTWGHDKNGNPIETENIKLDWLLSAGNINISLPDYAHLIQNFLSGFAGKYQILSERIREQLLLGNPTFSFGWFVATDSTNINRFVYNFGNANGFMSSVIIAREGKVAFIVLTNVSSMEAEEAIQLVLKKLKIKYSS